MVQTGGQHPANRRVRGGQALIARRPATACFPERLPPDYTAKPSWRSLGCENAGGQDASALLGRALITLISIVVAAAIVVPVRFVRGGLGLRLPMAPTLVRVRTWVTDPASIPPFNSVRLALRY